MALISSIAEIKNYIAIDVNAKVATLKPFIDEAEQLYLISLLGKSFYDEFSIAYKASVDPSATELNPDNAALLPYIQRCVAYYMQLQAIPQMCVTFGDQGIRTNRGEDSDPASRWLIEKLQYQALKNGDIYADKLLEFLEDNASASKYGTWYASTSNTINSGFIIYSTAVASKHIEINSSRRIFLQLRNKIREIETRLIPKLIGVAQYNELVTQLKTGGAANPTKANKLLIDKLEPIICKRALYLQLDVMRVSLQQDGIWLYSDTSFETRDRWFLADDDAIDDYKEKLEGDCNQDFNFGFRGDEAELRQFILDNINDYPLIKSSGVYTVQPIPGPTWITLNNNNTKHFGV